MKNYKTSMKVKERIVATVVIVSILLTVLLFRLGQIQVIQGDKYLKKALESQTRDVEIPAKRGIIYDRNGKELATSAVTYTIWLRMSTIFQGKTEEEGKKQLDDIVKKLSINLNLSEEKIYEKIKNNKNRPKIAKYVEKKIAEKIQKEKLLGVEMDQNVKRYYPLGAFASHVLGSVTDDNHGLSGLELKYDKYLRGVPGRKIKKTDTRGNTLSMGSDKFYQAEDGLNLYLTIDEVIQHYVEKAVETVHETTEADKVMCIVMNPKNGEILAMAMTPEYDPNFPRIPLDADKMKALENMNDEEKMECWNKMWRNPMVSDTFEPGSTFKLLTTAISLEEQVANLNSEFVCNGSCKVADKIIRCWRYPRPHGSQNLLEGVGNSCNPVFVELVKRIGTEKYYKYLEDFGFMDKTNIDYPGETNAILYNKKTLGPVELATMSYGHGIAATPLQVLTAISSFGNDGKVMQPRLVKKLVDRKGNVVKEFPEKIIKKVMSKVTVEEMKLVMESVVAEYGGKIAKIKGYRIGGKSGTALKLKNGQYGQETYASFVAMAPMEDPEISLIFSVDNPKNSMYGSVTAGPGVKMILEDTLRYLDIKPNYTIEEKKSLDVNKKIIPDVTGMNFQEAKEILKMKEINFSISPKVKEEKINKIDFVIVDQFPKQGNMINENQKIYLYRE